MSTGTEAPWPHAARRRSSAEHDPGCTKPGWSIQAPILERGPLVACCRGCSAVRITARSAR